MGADAEATLEVWDAHLVEHGSELVRCRLETLTDLMPHVAHAYEQIAPTNNVARGIYKTSLGLPGTEGGPDGEDADPGVAAPARSIDDGSDGTRSDRASDTDTAAVDTLVRTVPDRGEIAAAMRARLAERRRDELVRGVSLVGPHRDDVTLMLGELPAKGYASHGESWSYALSLRLGAFELLRAEGIEPVLVLDDVFAELDATRRDRLAALVAAAEQVLITAAVAGDVPAALAGTRFTVGNGTVTADETVTADD